MEYVVTIVDWRMVAKRMNVESLLGLDLYDWWQVDSDNASEFYHWLLMRD